MEVATFRLGDYKDQFGWLYKNWRTPEGTFNWFILDNDTLGIGDVDNHSVAYSLFLIREEGIPETATDQFRERLKLLREELKAGRHLRRVRWAGTCEADATVTNWSAPSLAASAPAMLHRSGILSRLREAVRLFDGYSLPPGTGEYSPG